MSLFTRALGVQIKSSIFSLRVGYFYYHSSKNTIRLFSVIRGIFGELNFNYDFIFTNNQISVNRKEVNAMIYTLRLS